MGDSREESAFTLCVKLERSAVEMCELHSEEYVRRGICKEIVSVWSGIKFSEGKR